MSGTPAPAVAWGALPPGFASPRGTWTKMRTVCLSSLSKYPRGADIVFAIGSRTDGRGGADSPPASPQAPQLAGLYQLSSPACRRAPASAGVSVPLMTLALAFQVSFSRFGVPRDRIW